MHTSVTGSMNCRFLNGITVGAHQAAGLFCSHPTMAAAVDWLRQRWTHAVAPAHGPGVSAAPDLQSHALRAAGVLSRGALQALPSQGGAALAALLRSHAGDLTARAHRAGALVGQVHRSVLVISGLHMWQGGWEGGRGPSGQVGGQRSGGWAVWAPGGRLEYHQAQAHEEAAEAQRLFANATAQQRQQRPRPLGQPAGSADGGSCGAGCRWRGTPTRHWRHWEGFSGLHFSQSS